MKNVEQQFENCKTYLENLTFASINFSSVTGKIESSASEQLNAEDGERVSQIIEIISNDTASDYCLLPQSNLVSLLDSHGEAVIVDGSVSYYKKTKTQEYLLSLTTSTVEELKKSYENYLLTKENLLSIKKNTPVNFISQDKTIKGFNQDGELIVIFENENSYVTVDRDKGGKIISLTDEKGEKVSFKYDSNGRLQYVFDARGRITEISYLNETISIIYPSGQVLTLTQTENKITQAQINGLTATFEYVDGALSKIIRSQAEQNIDEFSFEKVDNQVSMTDFDKTVTKYALEYGEITAKTVLVGGVVTEAYKVITAEEDGVLYPSKTIVYAKKDSLYKDESQLTFADGTEENPYEKYALTNFNDDENPVYTEELSENVLTKT
ncbi:MAG: RHS repeat protein, partial [Clostridia bacterium]|nr:RHS repeat protein [Clostridia bacterium]